MTEREKISCSVPRCECYPFVHFKCNYCQEIWVTHCKRGYKPRELCTRCLEEEYALTSHTLVVATNAGIIELDSPKWYYLFKKGVRGKLDSKAQALAIECRRSNKVPCSAEAVKLSRWGPFKRRWAARSIYSSPEEYSCCREDGLPRHGWQPRGRRQRQRSMPVENPDGPESNNGQNGQSAP